MEAVFIVSSDKRVPAEDALRRDDIVSRQSITLKQASALGFGDGYFIIVQGTPEAVALAEELLAGLAQKYDNAAAVLAKLREEEDRAVEGFGNILG